MKNLLFILMSLMGHVVFAHQPDLSTIVISKTADEQIILQINSSLTAFQGEIKYHHPNNAYTTPEEFKRLVVKHFLNTFSFIINETDTLHIKNPIVILGHATQLIAELIGVPQKINSLSLKSDVFKDIHNNQSVIIFAVDGFPTNKLVLNNDNHHEINMWLNDGQWENVEVKNSSFNLGYLFLFLLLIFIAVFMYYKMQKTTKEQKNI